MVSARATFADLVLHHGRLRPEKPAIVLADRVVTYDMMAQGILHVEDRLRELRLAPAALVGNAIESPIRHMIVAAALCRLGHPSLSIRRIGDVLRLKLPVAAFLHAGEELHLGQNQIFVGDDWFAGDRRPVPAVSSCAFSDQELVCRVELSSGTTGQPKAVGISVRAFNEWCLWYYPAFGLGEWSRLLCLPGLTSSWGFSLAAHTLFAGRTLVFAATPRDWLHMISVYGIDAVAASTQHLREMVREQIEAPIPCPSLRVVFTGGSLLARSLMLEARTSLCNSIINSYGSTEAGISAFSTVERLPAIEGATGYVAPWAEIEAVDDNGDPVVPGTDGVIRIRASCQGATYPPGAPEDHAGFRHGWFYPGDRGRVCADGLLVLSGRTSDVINVGGVKTSPDVIEEMLRHHPAVIELAAIGRVGANGMEEITLMVVPRHAVAEQAIVDWCAEHGVPVARVVLASDLPKTASGKLNRELISQLYLS